MPLFKRRRSVEPPPIIPGTMPPVGVGAEQRAVPPTPPGHRGWGRRARSTPTRPCLNCGDTSIGWYCPTCGQRKMDVAISLRRMLMEALEDQLSLNSTLPRTLGALFFRPGHLTREYVQGRIVRYIPPFRLYLVSSLLFFILIPLVPGVAEINMGDEDLPQPDSIRIAMEVDSVLLARARAAGQDTTAFKNPARGLPAAGLNMNLAPDPAKVAAPLRPLVLRITETEQRLNALPRREAVALLRDAFL